MIAAASTPTPTPTSSAPTTRLRSHCRARLKQQRPAPCSLSCAAAANGRAATTTAGAAVAAAGWLAAAALMLVAPPTRAATLDAAAADAASTESVLPSVLPCRPRTSCVSSASISSPSQYLSPWSFSPDSRAAATRALVRALEDAGAGVGGGGDVRVVEGPDATTVEARVVAAGGSGSGVWGGGGGGGKTGGSTSGGDADRVLFRLRDDGVALFSAQAEVNRRDPPFCLVPGCISGPVERARLAALRDSLGWAVLEADGGEDAVWQQIMLH